MNLKHVCKDDGYTIDGYVMEKELNDIDKFIINSKNYYNNEKYKFY